MTDALKKTAIKLGTEGPVKTLPTPRKVQLLFGGVFILRTTNAVFVWEHPYYPQFYLPKDEFLQINKQNGVELKEGESIKGSNGKPVATQYTIKVGSKSTEQVIVFSDSLEGKAEEIQGLVKIEFSAMDQWFEEDAPMHVHPKDPFKRVDILPSTREVKVSVDGHTIAHTTSSWHLYETGLPVRYYLPLTSVDTSVLRPSTTKMKCPYKGEAEYYNVEIDGKTHDNLFWYYVNPILESAKIEGLLCPYNERVDIELDGKKLERPQTVFSNKKVGEKPI